MKSESMSTNLRVCVVGAGKMGADHIERLTRLLKEMSLETQFILITHSKKTMEAAQAMYGVTMQEPGVSKLVSVKFHPMVQPMANGSIDRATL